MRSSTTPASHPLPLWALKFLLLLLGVMALVSGSLLIISPDGKLIQFPAHWLDQTPFRDYLVPGLLLTVFMGILPLVAWWALWKKPQWSIFTKINPIPSLHFAWALAFSSACALMIWILVQVTMIPYFFLQPVLFCWGLLIAVLALLPGVRSYYRVTPRTST